VFAYESRKTVAPTSCAVTFPSCAAIRTLSDVTPKSRLDLAVEPRTVIWLPVLGVSSTTAEPTEHSHSTSLADAVSGRVRERRSPREVGERRREESGERGRREWGSEKVHETGARREREVKKGRVR
jgi:hypothetical protein